MFSLAVACSCTLYNLRHTNKNNVAKRKHFLYNLFSNIITVICFRDGWIRLMVCRCLQTRAGEVWVCVDVCDCGSGSYDEFIVLYCIVGKILYKFGLFIIRKIEQLGWVEADEGEKANKLLQMEYDEAEGECSRWVMIVIHCFSYQPKKNPWNY